MGMCCYDPPDSEKKRMRGLGQRRAKADIAAEGMYLFAFGLYMLRWSFDTTLYHFFWPISYEPFLRIVLGGVILLKIGAGRKPIGKECAICILSFVLFKLSWISTEYDFLLDTSLLMTGATGISYKKILKTGFWIDLYVLLIAMVGSFAGCIDDLYYVQKGHSFGGYYPTDFAAHSLFLLMGAWVLYGKVAAWSSAIGPIVLALVLYMCCGARCSVMVLGLLSVGMIWHFVIKKYEGRKTLTAMNGWINTLLRYLMPLCATLMILLTCFYEEGSDILELLNALLSGRLKLGRAAIDNYGITLFGTPFETIGAGGTTALPLEYNFIDSSYVMILLRYGAMILLLLFVQYIWMQKKAINAGLQKVVLAAGMIAIHSMIEHHFLELTFNLLLVFPFASFEREERERSLPQDAKGNQCKRIAGSVALIISLPWTMDYLRTIVDTLQLGSPEKHIWFVIIATMMLSMIFFFVYAIFNALYGFIRKKQLSQWDYVAVAVSLLFFIIVAVWSEKIVQTGMVEFQSRMDDDEEIIGKLLAADDSVGRLYVEYAPEVYRRRFGKISHGILAPEKAPFRRNVTLIADNEVELQALMNAGFLYGEISPERAVYTNSAVAAEILTESGILLSDHYNKKTTENLEELAVLNGLVLTDESTLLLCGSENSLYCGPGVTICSGKLQVEYDLRLINAGSDAGIVATAAITSYLGEWEWQRQEITAGDFDREGRCLYKVDTWLGMNCSGMEFLLFAADGVELEVVEIRYGKIR